MIAAASAPGLVATSMPSPVGELTLVGGERGLAAVLWENDAPERVPLAAKTTRGEHPVLARAERQLREYFAGERTAFDLPLDIAGTAFQRRVWRELLAIPYGRTRAYGELASRLGDPLATRAVGAANGRNPLSIVVPCHRVIGASGALTGFAGGLRTKAYLLDLERGALPLPL